MFKPFTAQDYAGNSDGIRDAFNSHASGDENLSARIYESARDLEAFWNTPPDDWEDKVAAVHRVFVGPPQPEPGLWPLDGQVYLREAWLYTAFRKWVECGCHENRRKMVDRFKEMVPGAIPTTTEIQEFRQKQQGTELGVYHILFPVVVQRPGPEKAGFLVTASVSVHNISETDPQPKLQMTPWSYYRYDSHDAECLQETLPQALAAAGCSIERRRVVIDLSPVSTAIDAWGMELPEDLLTNLTYAHRDICGDSLELAVSIAAWAAREGLSVPPVAATGAVATDGQIQTVGHVVTKLSAMQRLRNQAPHILMLFPAANRFELQGGQADSYRYCDHLQVLFNTAGILTDGFDKYRELCGKQHKPEWYRDPGWQDKADWDDVGEQICNNLSPAIPESPLRKSVVLPFIKAGDARNDGFTPETVAKWCADQFMVKVNQQPEIEKSGYPVALAVSMQKLFPSGGADDPVAWHQVLSECANHQQVPHDSMAVTPDAMAIALRRSRKLVLFVFDEPSTLLWNRIGKSNINTDKSKRRGVPVGYMDSIDKLKAFSGLSPGAENGLAGWARQSVVLVCSDYRHQLLWEDDK